ncbi:MAG: SMC-Scp complex subunit ScpB [Clostridiales bacterium]|nr:SMC-Scp complex subunit ScpB [Clostridiales bacterium]
MENDNIDESEKIRNTEYSEDDQTDSDQTDDDQDTDAPQYKEYSDEYLTSALEAILFSVGESVSVDRLASALEMEKKVLVKQLENIIYNYNNSDRGIRIVELDGSLQLCTRNEYYGILAKIVNTPKKLSLTDVVLETLSIIAYKQPITRPEIEAIRGVSCVHAINKLIEYNLVQEVGRMDAPGRPIMFGTTEEFLRCFGVSSTSDLPLISPDKIEDFKKEALEEADFTLSVDTSED